MKVKITYTVPGNETLLEDVLIWPDVTDEAALPPLVSVYLDNKYGQGAYTLIRFEVI